MRHQDNDSGIWGNYFWSEGMEVRMVRTKGGTEKLRLERKWDQITVVGRKYDRTEGTDLLCDFECGGIEEDHKFLDIPSA